MTNKSGGIDLNLILLVGLGVGAIYLLSSTGKNLKEIFTSSEAKQEFRDDKLVEKLETYNTRQDTKQLRQEKQQARIVGKTEVINEQYKGKLEKSEDKNQIADIRRDSKAERVELRQDAKTQATADKIETKQAVQKAVKTAIKSVATTGAQVVATTTKQAVQTAKNIANKIKTGVTSTISKIGSLLKKK